MEKITSDFSKNQPSGLRETANKAISQAALENDSLKASLAVVAYALGKILEKEHFQKETSWPRIQSSIRSELINAVMLAKKQDFNKLKIALLSITNRISKIDYRFGNYWQNLIEKSRVKQASSAYALGVSLSQATQLTGCDKEELFNYIGFTKMHEETPVIKTIRERVESLSSILKGEKR